MKRRNFLKNTSGFLSIPMLLKGLPIQATGSQLFFNAIEEDNDKILVLIQMNGGNDGLNTIIPLDKYDILGNVRSNILIPSDSVIKATDNIGFHPSMTGIKSLYDEGSLTVLQDVGYPNQNRSHFRSTDIWTTGSPSDEIWTTGWLGRYLESFHPEYPEGFPNDNFEDPFALSIGSVVSETCQGTLTNFSLALTDPLSIATLNNDAQDEVPNTPYGRELDFLRTTIDQANEYGTVISAAAEKGSNSSIEYPDSGLANQLKAIALLASGGLGTKIYIANIGGFDTHANQTEEGATDTGDHATLLQDLSEAVYAFQQDLKSQGLEERVLTMTFSEFGRRIKSNGSFGTDHGTAAPMMFFGSCINPGFIGESPLLPAVPENSDGVPMQFDFRSVYGSVLIDWFGIDKSVVDDILEDEFTHIPIVSNCNQTTPTEEVFLEKLDISNYPNPFDNWTTLSFDAPGGNVRISIFDAIGHELEVISNGSFSPGRHEIKFDSSRLPLGNYYCRVISQNGIGTIGLTKVAL